MTIDTTDASTEAATPAEHASPKSRKLTWARWAVTGEHYTRTHADGHLHEAAYIATPGLTSGWNLFRFNDVRDTEHLGWFKKLAAAKAAAQAYAG